MLFANAAMAQKKLEVKYYLNDTELPLDNVRIFIVTRNDTIDLKIDDGKVHIPKKLKDNFYLYGRFDGKTMKIGSFRPALFNNLYSILLGRITDFSAMKKHYSNNNVYRIAEEYWINVPNSANIGEYVYALAGNYINISHNTDYAEYFPTTTGSYEVVRTKE